MAEPRVIVSPKENIAERQVINVQDAQTRIKELIVQGYYQRTPKAELEAQIAKVIQTCADAYPETYRESVRRTLAINAQKWHYNFFESIRVLNYSLIRKAADVDAVRDAIRVENKTYSVDVQQIAGLGAEQTGTIVDRFRPFLTEDRVGAPIIAEYEKGVKSQIRALASDPANLTRVDKNGEVYKVNLRNFAEMQTRYEANLEDKNRLQAEGVKLVWTSSHADASGRCAPYQGRLYSLDGTSGRTTDGIPYTPLDEALLGPRGDGNGIINGYNCRHRLVEYFPKSKAPKEVDDEKNRQERYITTRQREYERQIRNIKIEERLATTAGREKEAQDYRNQWQRLDASYRYFSNSHGRAYYEWRTRVTNDEVDWQNK